MTRDKINYIILYLRPEMALFCAYGRTKNATTLFFTRLPLSGEFCVKEEVSPNAWMCHTRKHEEPPHIQRPICKECALQGTALIHLDSYFCH